MNDTPPVVRLTSVAGYAAAIPYLLGFAPTESLVVTALRGERVVANMRVDLPRSADEYPDYANAVFGRLIHANADGIMAAIVTDATGRRVHAGLVDALDAGPLPLIDAVLVRDGRAWSVRCEDRHCCPADGVPLPDPVEIAAATALHQGRAPLPNRDALIASVQRSTLAMLVESALANPPVAALPNLGRFIDPRATLGVAEAAAAVLALADVRTRDEFIARLEEEATFNLLRALLPMAPAGHDADVCACYALAVYLRGDGTLAQAAVDRALESTPAHPFACILEQILTAAMPPDVVRKVMFADAT